MQTVPLVGMARQKLRVLEALCYFTTQISLPQCTGEQRGAANPHDRHGLEAHG